MQGMHNMDQSTAGIMQGMHNMDQSTAVAVRRGAAARHSPCKSPGNQARQRTQRLILLQRASLRAPLLWRRRSQRSVHAQSRDNGRRWSQSVDHGPVQCQLGEGLPAPQSTREQTGGMYVPRQAKQARQFVKPAPHALPHSPSVERTRAGRAYAPPAPAAVAHTPAVELRTHTTTQCYY